MASSDAAGAARHGRAHLLLAYDFPPISGGIARMLGELARRYPAGQLVVSTGQVADSEEVDERLPNRVDRLPIPARRLRTLQGVLVWSRHCAVLARSTGAGFIWCGNLKPAAYPAKWTRERTGLPFGVLAYGGDFLTLRHQVQRSILKRKTARALLASASVFVAISDWTRQLVLGVLRDLGVETPEEDVVTVPLGTDPAFFRPGLDTAAVRARYDLGAGPLLLSVSRLVPHKGIDTVMQALAALGDEARDVRYAVVGRGEAEDYLRKLARQLGLADRVRFLTNVPDSDLPALYNAASAYVGVSRLAGVSVEGFGISLTEAMACGVPVIGGRSGGVPEVVTDGETGLLVDAEQPAAVAAALRTVLGDPALAARLGAAGRARVEAHFNWDRVAADLRTIGDRYASAAVAR